MHWWPTPLYAALDTQASTLNTALAGVLFQLQKAVQSTIKSNLGGWQSDTSLFENSTGNPTLAELRGLIYSHTMHYLAVGAPLTFLDASAALSNFPLRTWHHTKLITRKTLNLALKTVHYSALFTPRTAISDALDTGVGIP